MTFRILSPDARGQIDRPLKEQLLDFLPKGDELDLVPLTYHFDYQFNPKLLELKRYVLLDYSEQGWDWDQEKENRLGLGALRSYTHFDSDEWGKLDEFVRDHPPILTFKRELLARHRGPTMQPIEHLCTHRIPPVQSEAEFERRLVDVLHVWGWSNPSRALLHSDIFRAMTDKGIEVLSELRQFDLFKPTPPGGGVWATIYAPWFCRNPIKDVLKAQLNSKISVSLPGAGLKCFRHAEAPIGSIMALRYDNLAWSYPWLNQQNCICLRGRTLFDDLMKSVNRADLYDIYLASQETIAKYQSATYVRDYFLPTVETVL